MTYMTTYARETLKLSGRISLVAPIINGTAGVLFGLAGGLLADRFGRRAMMIWPRAVFILALWPVYYLMASQPRRGDLVRGHLHTGRSQRG